MANDRSTGAYAALCLTCHGGGSWEASGAADIKQYVTYGASDTGIGAAGGHRIKSSGGTLPVNAPLPCYDCHDPHGSPNQYHFVTTVGDKTGVSVPGSPQWGPLCGGCHAGDASGWHQYCEDCHHSPDSHVNPPDPAYMDCATCHAHGATWTHPVTCHCYPYERTYQTF